LATSSGSGPSGRAGGGRPVVLDFGGLNKFRLAGSDSAINQLDRFSRMEQLTNGGDGQTWRNK